MGSMKIHLLPRTDLGKLSFVAFVISWILFFIGSVLPYSAGSTGWAFVKENPLQVVVTVLILIVATLSVIWGLRSFIKYKEGSVLVLLAVLSGFYSIIGAGISLIALFFLDRL